MSQANQFGADRRPVRENSPRDIAKSIICGTHLDLTERDQRDLDRFRGRTKKERELLLLVGMRCLRMIRKGCSPTGDNCDDKGPEDDAPPPPRKRGRRHSPLATASHNDDDANESEENW